MHHVPCVMLHASCSMLNCQPQRYLFNHRINHPVVTPHLAEDLARHDGAKQSEKNPSERHAKVRENKIELPNFE